MNSSRLTTTGTCRPGHWRGSLNASPRSTLRRALGTGWCENTVGGVPGNGSIPAAPKVGIRAARPNEIRHIDTSVLRLLDGSRAYLQAVIDNFSRRVLAWKVSGTFDPNATVGILLKAAQGVSGDKPMLAADGGVENFNGAVDELIASGLLSRVLAQTEITFSNSLIESWWRVLKHQ